MSKISRAICYCEGALGNLDGKTTHGVVARQKKYEIVGIVDSKFGATRYPASAGGVPVLSSVTEALAKLPEATWLLYGKAPVNGVLDAKDRRELLMAINSGLSVACGLHAFLTDDEEFTDLARLRGVSILDIRKPRCPQQWRTYSGAIADSNTPVLPVFGSDCACGKRTTAFAIYDELCARGIQVELVCTGQTGMLQGARFGVVLDALPTQAVIGELEHAILQALNTKPTVVIVEGQGALSHPAFLSSVAILKCIQPRAVILQHPLERLVRCDFPAVCMPSVNQEKKLLENFTKVIGIGVHPESLAAGTVELLKRDLCEDLNIPVSDVLIDGAGQLVDAVIQELL